MCLNACVCFRRKISQGHEFENFDFDIGIENKSESENDNFMHLIMINI